MQSMAKPLTDKKTYDVIQSLFLRPFARRMKYIYTGMDIADNTYVLGNIDEEEYRFVARNQAMGLVHIKDAETHDLVTSWFEKSGMSFFDRPGLLHIVELSTLVKKYNYHMDAIPFQADGDGCIHAEVEPSKYICIYTPFYLFFIFDIYRSAASQYAAVFIDHIGLYADLPITEAIETAYKKVVVPKDQMQRYDYLAPIFPGTFKAVLLKGLDYIVIKNTDIQKASCYGVRLWHLSGNALSYGFRYETETQVCVAARMNAVAILSKQETATGRSKGISHDRDHA